MPIGPDYLGIKKSGAMHITLMYCVLASIWILASSYIVNFSINDPDTIARLELFKGLLFVFGTGGLLYLILRFSPVKNSHQALGDPANPARTITIALLFIALTLI